MGRLIHVADQARWLPRSEDVLPKLTRPAPSRSRHNGEFMLVACTPEGHPCRQEASCWQERVNWGRWRDGLGGTHSDDDLMAWMFS